MAQAMRKGAMRLAVPSGVSVGICILLLATVSGASPETGATASAALATPLARSAAAPTVSSLSLDCKLISERSLLDPTANNTHFRANLAGTDLGISATDGSRLWILFGDTMGFRGAWLPGSGDDPDSIAYVDSPYGTIRNDPRLLCTRLRFVTTPNTIPQVGNRLDSRIERDFAAISMMPPSGERITRFVTDPPSAAFANLPGTFEVPSGAFFHGGNLYAFYTGGSNARANPPTMEFSYLARWQNPNPNRLPSFNILYRIDELQAYGKFINVAPVVKDGFVYMFGTGRYRRSDLFLARKPVARLDSPGGMEYFTGGATEWRAARDGSAATPLIRDGFLGEVSVRYFEDVGVWAMIYQRAETNAAGSVVRNQLLVRTSLSPTGPWSNAAVVASMDDPAFRERHCCLGSECAGERMLWCERAGFYGAYLLPFVSRRTAGTPSTRSFTVHFLLSTWDPYNVVLMRAAVRTSARR